MGGHLENHLSPADVGKRVSVRSLTGPGEQRAAFTDTVGVLTFWTGGVLGITRRNGETVRLAESAVVAGKVVPPAPARRRGLPAAGVAELTAVAARGWPAVESARVGGWSLRAAAGWTRRANAALRLAGGAPDLAAVEQWYAARGLPARLQVATGGADTDDMLDAELARRGWAAEAPTAVLVGALAPLADRAPDARVLVGRALTRRWLAGLPAAARDPGAARRVLTGGPSVWFAEIPEASAGDGGTGSPAAPGEGAAAAVGRCVVDGRWAGFAAVRVAPAYRRKGLAPALMAELARAALAEGASAACLQVERDNPGARALYERLGFTEHHHYHYRESQESRGRPPEPGAV